MKILIIGCKGFIGSHAFKYFTSAGYETYGCDLVADYTVERYTQINATNSDFTGLISGVLPDVCINCAGAANVPYSLDNPLNDFYLNTFNVFRILEAIRRFQPACKFINISSAAVYGSPIDLPIGEYTKRHPISPYGFHKVMAEEICKEFTHFFGIRTCSLRVFSAYGPGLKKQLLWDVHRKTQQSTQIEMLGTGHETRDFIYVGDLVHLLELIMHKSAFNGEAINAGNGIQTTVREIIRLWLEITAWRGKVTFTGTVRKGDPLRWEADITKIQSMGYQSKVGLQEGINNYYQWVTENT